MFTTTFTSFQADSSKCIDQFKTKKKKEKNRILNWINELPFSTHSNIVRPLPLKASR